MPLVRIDLSKDAPDEVVQAVSQAVYDAMTTIAKVPRNDKFQIITRHAPEDLAYPASGYLGMEYTNGIIFIQVTWVRGRAVGVKKQFYRKIADDICAATNVRREDIVISLVNSDREDWSFGNGDMQYAPRNEEGLGLQGGGQGGGGLGGGGLGGGGLGGGAQRGGGQTAPTPNRPQAPD